MLTIKDFPFKIGTDPEFTILFNDQTICAESLFRSIFKDNNINNNLMGCKIGKAGVIGWDGAHTTAELRPTPEKTPAKLIENIRTLLKAFSEKTKIYSLTTMSDKAPIGGHIHLEIVNEELKSNSVKINNINKKLSSFYTPIMAGEDIVNLRTRMTKGYGMINDHREDTKENNAMTMELRVPTAEWLTTPEIAQATFAYIATVYHEILNHPRNFNKAKEILIHSDKQNKALQELAITQYLPLTKMLINKIKKHIKTFEYYKHYEKEINFILSPQKIINEKKKADYDIMRGWKLTNTKQPNKKTLLSEKKIKELSLKIDMDQIMNSVKIQYNEDTNVRDFVKAIKQRIITLNWKLNANYFIFGLKPNIPNYVVTETKNDHHSYHTGQEMIETQCDFSSLQNSLNRMSERFSKNMKTKNILIGIPYEKRIKLNVKEFIELIYSIEKEKFTPTKIDREKLIDDTCLPTEKTGKLNRIYNSESIENMTIDSCETADTEHTARQIREDIAEVTRNIERDLEL